MRITIISQHFFPDTFRINDIAWSLSQSGHQVRVITGRPDYATGRVPLSYRRGKRSETIDGVDIVRVPTVARRQGVFFRALNYASFLINSSIHVFLRRKRYRSDVVYCYQTSPVMQAHAARVLQRITGQKMLLYCLDVWPESLKAWQIKESSWLFKVMTRYSGWIYRGCDMITVSSPSFMEYLHKTHHLSKARMVYQPQHAEPLDLVEKPYPKPGAPVRLAYGGNIGSVQDMDCILDCAHALQDMEQVVFDIYGDGSDRARAEEKASGMGLGDRVRFHGRVDFDTLKAAYQSCDGFILTLKNVGYIGDTVPAKLQEYMSGGRPVFAAVDGACADIIREARCGWVVPASDGQALADNIRRFINEPTLCADCGANGQAYFHDHFTRSIFVDTLMAYFHQLTEGA